MPKEEGSKLIPCPAQAPFSIQGEGRGARTKNGQGQEQEDDILGQQFPADLAAQRAETTAHQVEPAGHSDDNENDEGDKESGDDKSGRPPEKTDEEKGAADDLDPGESQGRD